MIEAKKSLGQHFLINQGVIDRIADQVLLFSEQGRAPVCEIGPGPGPLTEALLKRNLRVTAVEIEHRMVEHLHEKFSAEVASGQLQILERDAMALTRDTLTAAELPWVVCGNLPYNVGSQIVFHFLEDFPQAERFCFMLQKEVVLRFIAERGAGRDYGGIGIKMAWLTRPQGHFWVKPGSFRPPPKVDSGVFSFVRRNGPELPFSPTERGGAYDRASRLVSRIFQQRRKMLRGQIPALASLPIGALRPEDLSPEEWLRLAAEHG